MALAPSDHEFERLRWMRRRNWSILRLLTLAGFACFAAAILGSWAVGHFVGSLPDDRNSGIGAGYTVVGFVSLLFLHCLAWALLVSTVTMVAWVRNAKVDPSRGKRTPGSIGIAVAAGLLVGCATMVTSVAATYAGCWLGMPQIMSSLRGS